MARQARQESSTGYYHLMMRGINGESIFGQDRGKLHFLELLQGQQEEGLLSLVAWCVMDTHAHVMVKAKKQLTSIVIRSSFGSFVGRWCTEWGFRCVEPLNIWRLPTAGSIWRC